MWSIARLRPAMLHMKARCFPKGGHKPCFCEGVAGLRPATPLHKRRLHLLIVLTFFFALFLGRNLNIKKLAEVEIGQSRLGRTRKNGRSRNWPKSTASVSVSVAMRRMCPVNNLMNTDGFMLDCRTSAALQHRYGHINHVVNVPKLENLDVFYLLVVSSPVTARGPLHQSRHNNELVNVVHLWDLDGFRSCLDCWELSCMSIGTCSPQTSDDSWQLKESLADHFRHEKNVMLDNLDHFPACLTL